MGRAREHASERTDDRFGAVVGLRRGVGIGLALEDGQLSVLLRTAIGDADSALARAVREPALALLASAPRACARSPQLGPLIAALAGEATVRVGTGEWELAEEAVALLDVLPSAPHPRLGQMTVAQAAVSALVEERLREDLAGGSAITDVSVDAFAGAAWRAHICQLLAERTQTGGWAAFQHVLGAGLSRNLAKRLRLEDATVSRQESQALRVRALTSTVFALALHYLAETHLALASTGRAPGSALARRLREIIYVGVGRELGYTIPLPPALPTWMI